MSEDTNNVRGSESMLGFVLGVVVGAGVALLFAPAPGHTTRKRVGETATKFGHAAREKFGEARGKLNQMRDDMRRRREHVAERAEHVSDRIRGYGEGIESEGRPS